VSFEVLVGNDGTGLDHLPQFQTHDFDDSEFADGHDAAVRALESETRDAYILGELRGLPSREAAPLLGISHTTAATRRELATTFIREEITA
jgi:DNA-directed RNA polymerase specialized sigma24 family protein